MRSRHRFDGFTLAEMAIVLVIIALLLGGLLAPLGAQMESRQRTENEKTLADIREALIGFAIVNGRLPCPANRSIASGAAGAGMEATTAGGSCACATPGVAGGAAACATAGVTGVLPWATLGLSETDAWSNRFTYRITALFGRSMPQAAGFGCTPPAPPANAAFALCSPGNITIQNIAGTSIATQIPAVVVSHGKNGLGAWLPTGAPGPVALGAEGENANDDVAAVPPLFVSDTSIDDQLVWVPTNILMNRMIAAGKLP